MIQSSQASIGDIQSLTKKIEVLVDSINSGRGTVGQLINDPEFAHKVTHIVTDLQTITGAIANGKGSIGKLVNDDTLYTHAELRHR